MSVHTTAVLVLTTLLSGFAVSATAQGVRTSSPENVGMSADRLLRIRPVMQGYVDAGRVAGVVTLIARHGEAVHFESVGMAHTEADAPMRPDTIFRIYSMTKPITSVAVMMLYEQGQVLLSDSVSKYIPEFTDLRVYDANDPNGVAPERPMTVRDLLTHTSGLIMGWGGSPVAKAYQEADLKSGSLADMVPKLAKILLAHHPGTVWDYSISTDVLAHLVERISAVPFDEYLAREIFEPLGMGDTAFHVPVEKQDRFAASYGWDRDTRAIKVIDDPRTGAFALKPAFLSGAGGLVSTANDYYRFTQMLLNGGELDGVRLLGRKTVEYMTRDHLPRGAVVRLGPRLDPSVGWGLGFLVVRNAAERGVIGSDGSYSWGGLAGTAFWVDPQENLIGLLFIQRVPGDVLSIGDEFRALTYQALVD
ncbi:beta-lactamase family protein [Candidatus Poribacteria bacterium]|jgi:CubicO group peptidase (beta-lactamase class C family)|nr:beta-lactamase family protein [Candidatus Poribacteria bacterium]MBT5533131.1 beta-lactamase family protein [Candidatus Poribacteria bacterium]MBT5711140.1 beta-lactamase family protein [Candidatus Poribacteria bacterium]MBT7096393.1 beta-lactamase family protein [Candidatus Poribacteria bacterium]MBT7804211.1 beta-lactamase family protein [Candidatus Poribacteria bacterium]